MSRGKRPSSTRQGKSLQNPTRNTSLHGRLLRCSVSTQPNHIRPEQRTPQHFTASHRIPPHRTAQHSTAPHSTVPRSTTRCLKHINHTTTTSKHGRALRRTEQSRHRHPAGHVRAHECTAASSFNRVCQRSKDMAPATRRPRPPPAPRHALQMHEPPTGHAPKLWVVEPHSLRSQNCSWQLQHVCFPGRYLGKGRARCEERRARRQGALRWTLHAHVAYISAYATGGAKRKKSPLHRMISLFPSFSVK